MSLKRTTISLPAGLYEKGEHRMVSLDFTSFSDYVAHLIRQDVGAYQNLSDDELFSLLKEKLGKGSPQAKARLLKTARELYPHLFPTPPE